MKKPSSERKTILEDRSRSRMGHFERKYRDGVQSYIMSLTPEKKKEFEYRLYQDINLTRRLFREYKERLAEELAALAFLQSEMYVIPFKKEEKANETAEIKLGRRSKTA